MSFKHKQVYICRPSRTAHSNQQNYQPYWYATDTPDNRASVAWTCTNLFDLLTEVVKQILKFTLSSPKPFQEWRWQWQQRRILFFLNIPTKLLKRERTSITSVVEHQGICAPKIKSRETSLRTRCNIPAACLPLGFTSYLVDRIIKMTLLLFILFQLAWYERVTKTLKNKINQQHNPDYRLFCIIPA